MINQAATPLAAQDPVFTSGDQARVLDRDHGLIIVAIERPGLNLSFGALTAMQLLMERMQTVIAPRTDVVQPFLKLAGREQHHNTISIPSSAISHPAAST